MPDAAIDPIHAVLNQSSPLDSYDSFASDRPLAEAVARYAAGWAAERLGAAARKFTDPRVLELAALANEYQPVLRTYDRFGRRSDVVEYHPAWHELLGLAVGEGLVASPWTEHRAGSHVARAAMFYLYAQAESGTQCPIAMSFGAVPVIQRHADSVPAIADLWLPKLLSGVYDPRFVPAAEKEGVLFGMGMTERQGGSDVRSNITRAMAIGKGGVGAGYAITGHKWFMSAPMCDAFLVLAQADKGISCFLVPRFREDGSLNAIHIQRLKDKMGNRSNASCEVEFHAADGVLIGNEGRGVSTIIEMATYTRLDCTLATAGMQRRALAVALHHASEREAFGARLARQPLMMNVLADLAIEAEASTSVALYLAHCFDPESPEDDRLFGRLLTPAAKFHVCKRGPQFAAEAIEVIGGNGYVEDNDLPRIYREMPLLSIWEGSGNVMCLDVLRVLSREPDAAEVLRERLSEMRGAHAAFDSFARRMEALLQEPSPADGRRIAHAITLAVQGMLLIRHAPTEVADAFCRTRLVDEGNWGTSFGTLPPGVAVDALLERAGSEIISDPR